jgi:stage V sporulation protein SpoVS
MAPQRAVELIGVSYAESGLDATNYYGKSSGVPWQGEGKQAAGLFQLLSGGYIAKAEAIGKKRGDAPGTAVFDPTANVEAILPSYAAYFKSNPNAVAGAAGSSVEASGESASWYAGGESSYLKAAGYKNVDEAIKAFGGASGGTAKEQVTLGSVPGANAVGGAARGAADAVTGAVDSLSSVGKALSFLFSYRGLEVIGGGILIIVGIVGLMREVGVKSPTLPGPAGKVVSATGGS